jgi:hypothetical protein
METQHLTWLRAEKNISRKDESSHAHHDCEEYSARHVLTFQFAYIT